MELGKSVCKDLPLDLSKKNAYVKQPPQNCNNLNDVAPALKNQHNYGYEDAMGCIENVNQV